VLASELSAIVDDDAVKMRGGFELGTDGDEALNKMWKVTKLVLSSRRRHVECARAKSVPPGKIPQSRPSNRAFQVDMQLNFRHLYDELMYG